MTTSASTAWATPFHSSSWVRRVVSCVIVNTNTRSKNSSRVLTRDSSTARIVAGRAARVIAMPRPAAVPRKPRRTQAERRAATRAALLDAAIECLVEEGYANLTTRKVAERAGVSQGAQMHYFPTRAEFVAESVRHLAKKLSLEIREQLPPDASGDRRRLEWLLDQVWAVHNGPVFQATMELWVAARTDPE